MDACVSGLGPPPMRPEGATCFILVTFTSYLIQVKSSFIFDTRNGGQLKPYAVF